jgi:hypothetical protein
MCSQGYTLGLCKCIYHIKTHLWANKLQEKYKNKYQDIEKFWNTRWDVQLTLCLVDWYFSPGLPRPTNNQGCIGDKDEEKDEYDEDVWTVEVQHFERKGMNLFRASPSWFIQSEPSRNLMSPKSDVNICKVRHICSWNTPQWTRQEHKNMNWTPSTSNTALYLYMPEQDRLKTCSAAEDQKFKTECGI